MVNNSKKDTSVACTKTSDYSVSCSAEFVPNCKDVSSGCCCDVVSSVSVPINGCGDERSGDRSTDKSSEEGGRKRCSCRCHLQRFSPRNCPQKFKSRKNLAVIDSEKGTQSFIVGEQQHQQPELRHDGNVTSHPEQTRDAESHNRQYTGSRNRLKSHDFTDIDDRSSVVLNRSSSTSKSCAFKSLRTRLAAKKTMCRIVCQCFLVIVLCLCGTVLMTKHNYHDSSNGNLLHKAPSAGFNMGLTETEEPVPVIKDLPFKSVSLDVLEKHLETATSAADMLKIFFHDQNLSDDAVNSIMWMKSHRTLYGSDVKKHHHQRNHQFLGDGDEDEAKYREEAFNHYKSVSAFTACSEPKPEVVRVEEPQRFSFKHYMPKCTVLHRCSASTACCPKGYSCQPRSKNGIEIVHRHFVVLKQSADGKVTPHKNVIEHKPLINHTACECKKIEIDTNCHKQCPSQFTRQRPGEHCVCVCKHHNKKCRHMYRGHHALSEKDLECIKKGECMEPSCHTGTFKVQTGYCPNFRHHRHNSNRHKKG